ncbi:MAG: hypothetical protein ABR555_13525 [Pyrinomonadaceae bacterium]
MKKIICALTLLSALVFALAVQAAAPSFAGTWTLDKGKSQGLSSRMQGAESVTWTITQTDKQITIEEKVTGGNMGGGGAPGGTPPAGTPPGGGPGGGGPGRGGFGAGGPRTFNLDGSETPVDTGRGTMVRKATWSGDSKTLELSSKSTFQGPQGEVTVGSDEKLTLSADGKTLTVVRHSESPRGPQDSTYVFTKS